jgi:Tfp pilus assembly protein PilF
MVAGALLRSGHFDRAQRALDQSAQVAIETSQHAYDSEHARLQAELHSARGVANAAERSYHQALDTSRAQGARWLELRASRGYAHFLVGQGRTTEARDLLAPILQTIVEGRDTLDYLYAEGLMKTL